MTGVVHKDRRARRPGVRAAAGDARQRREATKAQERSDAQRLAAFDDFGIAMPKILKVVGSVVAPTTLVTALMLYFGRLHVTWFFQYFGVNFTALDLTPQDYLIRSVDGLFVPFAIAGGTTLVVVWTRRALAARLSPYTRRLLADTLIPAGVVAGLLLVGIAVIGILRPTAFRRVQELPGLALAIGTILLAYISRLRRRTAPAPHRRTTRRGDDVVSATALAEWTAVFVLVSIGLFWAVGNYAAAVGTSRGSQMEAELGDWPRSVLYSEQNLNLAGPGVTQVACTDPDAAYRYRYEGLKLVMQAGQQYFFLPSGWTRDDGAAILLPRGDHLRVEFTPADVTAPRPPAC